MNNGFTELMYRKPKSLEIIHNIRLAMSEESGFDIPTFVEMVRTGVAPSKAARTVTREEGLLVDEAQAENVTETSKIEVADQ